VPLIEKAHPPESLFLKNLGGGNSKNAKAVCADIPGVLGIGNVELIRRAFGRPKTTTARPVDFQRLSQELAP
jgi:hypothetical protein